jgi:FAD/FMN-containing dehydrogenase
VTVLAATVPGTRDDLRDFAAAIADIPMLDDPIQIRAKSQDFYWYSPILEAQLHGKTADLIVCPRNEADILRVARACARFRVPLTVRGGGTGNYGQSVPLEGGIVLDMSALAAIEWQRPGLVRVGAGMKMVELDAALRPQGWELRMHPSTKRSATIGGFVAGGSGGVGSITYGGLREAGNVAAARIVTLEDEPRILELRGREALAVNHAYGTTGIITALEMPLAPAWNWTDAIIAFDSFHDAVACGHALALTDGIVKKLLTPMAWPIPSFFKPFRAHCPEGRSILIAMIAEPSLEAFKELAAAMGGDVTYSKPSCEDAGGRPLYEYTWNHTTLYALKAEKSVTYLQAMYPAGRLREAVDEIAALFGDELIGHLEFIRFGGRVTASGLPVVRYTTPERLNEIIAIHEARGISIANPHVVTLEDGSRHKRADSDQLGFKRRVDPYGLLNPGKMRSFVAAG